MPNWTRNTVTMKGIAKLDLYDSDNNFDFSKIIPQPATKEECIEKYGEEYIDDGNTHLMHTESDEWFNWYKWNFDYWGTKWNANRSYIIDDDTIEFNTPWGTPEQVLIALSKQYSDREITLEAEFDDGWIKQVFKNGNIISEEGE